LRPQHREVLEDLGWTVLTAWQKESLATQADRCDGLLGRLNKSEVILERYLLQALRALNQDLPETAYQQAASLLKESAADKHLAAINKDKHELLVKGVPVSYQDDKGVLQKKRLRVFDFDKPTNNHFLAVRQFEVVGKLYNRRPDVIGFVNGIPLVFFELKAHHTDLRHAFDNNLSDYKDTIPEVLNCNAFVVLSNGTDSRVGTLTSPYKFFMEWKRIEEDDEGVVSLDTLLRGTCAPHRLLDLFENFLLFDGEGTKVAKIMAKNHQFIGVNKVVDQSANIDVLKGKLGVFWHTQGSGKSYSMVFLCQKILRKFGGSYTFLLVVDRTELEGQLYDTFSGVAAVTEDNVRARSREHLRELLAENHRYVFTLIHKFSIDCGNLNRGEKLGIENPELDERMADIINDAELDDDQRRKLEKEFKRDYPILTSESRLAAIAKDLVWHFNDRGYQGKAMFVALDKPTAVRMYDLVKKYWPEYVADLKFRIAKAEDQQEELKLKQHLKRVEETEVCVVMSSEQNEVQKFAKLALDIELHRKKMVARDLETEFKDENNPFRLVIVCAMWITGFDVPCVSTVYLDKPIKGHTLMQTIARANRVYDDEKENGLVVDYGNVYKQLEKAYSVYGEAGDKGKTNIDDEDEASGQSVEKLIEMVSELSDTILVVRQFLQDLQFDLDKLIHAGSAIEKLSQLKLATNAVCLNETTRTQYEVAARDVFRKYKAVYPEPEIKPFLKDFNAIEAIYDQLNQKTMQADISDVIRRLQQEVNISVTTRDNEVRDVDYVDLSTLDFDKLRAAFAKSNQKNAVVFDLQEAIQKKLEQMVQQNPIRLEFYEKYKVIIEEYNQGKDIQAVRKAFDDLNDFMQNDLAPEMERAMREGLDEETLAIFDLLKKPELTKAEQATVKEVAKQTLDTLKAEKLQIERWRESTQVTAQVKTLIDHSLQWLPQETYLDEELDIKSLLVYQHIYANYQGAGSSRYGCF